MNGDHPQRTTHPPNHEQCGWDHQSNWPCQALLRLPTQIRRTRGHTTILHWRNWDGLIHLGFPLATGIQPDDQLGQKEIRRTTSNDLNHQSNIGTRSGRTTKNRSSHLGKYVEKQRETRRRRRTRNEGARHSFCTRMGN